MRPHGLLLGCLHHVIACLVIIILYFHHIVQTAQIRFGWNAGQAINPFVDERLVHTPAIAIIDRENLSYIKNVIQ